MLRPVSLNVTYVTHESELLKSNALGDPHVRRFPYDVASFTRQIPDIRPKDEDFNVVLNMAAMSACYAQNPRAPLGFDLPFHVRMGRLFPEVWERFRRHDPVNMVARYAYNLRRPLPVHRLRHAGPVPPLFGGAPAARGAQRARYRAHLRGVRLGPLPVAASAGAEDDSADGGRASGVGARAGAILYDVRAGL